MLTFPPISPIAISLGPIGIRWYGLTYITTFLAAYFFLPFFITERKLPLQKPQNEFIADLLLGTLLGVILGGRLGYVLFYGLPFYLNHPLDIFKIWNGGMSFHGGMLGVILALYLFARREKLTLYELADTIIPIVPIGIFFVRIGNFINAELYGRITDSPICMRFPTDAMHCRYPSQLIEALLEGALLFALLFFLRKKIKTPGTLSWIFITGYGTLRFLAEFFREPDTQIGYLWGHLTEGQYLCLMMIIVGVVGIIWSRNIAKKRSGLDIIFRPGTSVEVPLGSEESIIFIDK